MIAPAPEVIAPADLAAGALRTRGAARGGRDATLAGGRLEDFALDPRCEVPLEGPASSSPDLVVIPTGTSFDVRPGQTVIVPVDLRSSSDYPMNVDVDVVGGVIRAAATATSKGGVLTLEGSVLTSRPLPPRSFRLRISLAGRAALSASAAFGTVVATGRILRGGCTCTRDGLCRTDVDHPELVPLARGLYSVALVAPFATTSSGKGFELRLR